MSVFDDLIQIGENGEIVNNQWIEWDHFLIPKMEQHFIAVGCFVLKGK